MPPKGPRLSPAEVAAAAPWIDAGAQVPAGEKVAAARRGSKHWAFQPVVRPAEPAVKDAAWARNAIDRFILARLEKEGIAPVAGGRPRHADPPPVSSTCSACRRPPHEVDAFVADTRPDAYERLVDRLLASPHYGERWGRHWLDQARYADSNGYSIDAPRSIWQYRDWVIDALNRDLPFDRFTVEQLAGDLLPGATLEQKVATGFHRNTQINQEGGIDLEQFRVEAVVDRVNTTGSVLLGLTVGCCQCHDHKFDPHLAAASITSSSPSSTTSTSRRWNWPAGRAPATPRKAQAEIARLEAELLAARPAHRRDAGEVGRRPDRRDAASAAAGVQDDPGHRGQRPRRRRRSRRCSTPTARPTRSRHVVGGLAGPLAARPRQLHLLTRRVDLEKQIARAEEGDCPPSSTTLVVQRAQDAAARRTSSSAATSCARAPWSTPGTPAVLPPLPSTERGRTGSTWPAGWSTATIR